MKLSDYNLERDIFLSIPSGRIPYSGSVNKFGRSRDVDSGVDVDIHDGSNASSWPSAALDERDTWTPPTQARTHQIASTSANDDGSPVGTGARTIQVFGLTSWTTREVSEVITLNGTTDVPTTNDYVIIHRMKVLTAGTSAPNVGTITATADTDATITAQINPGEGQTQMAVYGLSSKDVAYMVKYYLSAVKGAASVGVETTLLVNSTPDTELSNFVVKHTLGLATEGTSKLDHDFKPYFRINGPAIIKLSANASANNTDVSGGFDLILLEN